MFKKLVKVQKIVIYTKRNYSPTNLFSVQCSINQLQSFAGIATEPERAKCPKIVIIGAGIAGLSAAEHLIKENLTNFLILEASERYGGRVHTVKLGDAQCELGARWINMNTEENSLYRFALRNGLINSESFEGGDNEDYCVLSGQPIIKETEIIQLTSLLFKDILRDSTKFLTDDTPHMYGTADVYINSRIEKILSKMAEPDAQRAHHIFNSLKRCMSSKLGTDLGYIHVKHLGNYAKSFETPIFLTSGLSTVIDHLVNKIPKNQILLGKPIKNIEWDGIAIDQACVRCMDGSTFFADYIICTLPLGHLNVHSKRIFQPILPDVKQKALSALGIGSPGKIFLKYKSTVTPWFKGCCMCALGGQNYGSRENWTSGISKVSLVPGSKHVVEVKIGGRHNQTAERCTDMLIDRDVTRTFRKIMPNTNIPRPVEMIRSSWSTDAKYLGGIPFLSATCSEKYVSDLAAPLGTEQTPNEPRLLFAGDATCWNGFGTLEGARQSGIREAQRIVNSIRPTTSTPSPTITTTTTPSSSTKTDNPEIFSLLIPSPNDNNSL